MNCRRVERLLSDHLDGLLPHRQAGAIAAHVRDCPACRQLRGEIMALGAEYQALAEQLRLPDSYLGQRAVQQWTTLQEGSHPGGRFLSDWRVSGSRGTSRLLLSPRGIAMNVTAVAFLLAIIVLLRVSPGGHPTEEAERPAIGDRQTTKPDSPESSSELQRGRSERKPSRLSGSAALERLRCPVKPAAAPARRSGMMRQAFLATRSTDSSCASDRVPGAAKIHRSPTPQFRHQAAVMDDLACLNRDSKEAPHEWVPLRHEEWEKIEARIRCGVPVRDDFITIPFPRLVSTSDRQIAQAAEGYKREAAIVDSRLAREVTCAYKATALSDLCRQLRSDTGIELSAGPSVADEKVTLFCEKMPLREVMRQLSRPFGYTWLRSKHASGDSTAGSNPPYRYELVQDLRSQLLEEELRNRERNEALIALDREMSHYRKYLDLSPNDALEQAKSASPQEKRLLDRLARVGWAPVQLYFQLSPQEQAALRAGAVLTFQSVPEPGQRLLSPDLIPGIIYSLRDHQIIAHPREGRLEISADSAEYDTASETAPRALPPGDASAGFAMADSAGNALGKVTLSLRQSELGEFTLSGSAGLIMNTVWGSGSTMGEISLGTAASAAVLNPQNAISNAKLAADPALRARISVQPPASCREDGGPAAGQSWRAPPDAAGDRPSEVRGSPMRRPATAGFDGKVVSADVLEALHRATGMPIVADYYTRLYPVTAVSVKNRPLFDALNYLGDAMRLRWNKDPGPRGAGYPRSGLTWLQFRSASYYNDRLKEIPNRLLARWAASRRQRGMLTLDDLMEIAGLSDVQLDSESAAEGARCCFGLREWNLARHQSLRPHWRYLARLSPTQLRQAQGVGGLTFTQMSLPQQQQFLAFALSAASAAGLRPGWEDLSTSRLRVEYTTPVTLEGRPAEPGADQQRAATPRTAGPIREAGLPAARHADPPTAGPPVSTPQPEVKFVYLVGGPGKPVWTELLMRADLTRASSNRTRKH